MFSAPTFLLSQTALLPSTSSLPDPRPVHLPERIGRNVWIDVLAYRRAKITIKVLKVEISLKDRVIEQLKDNFVLSEGKFENEKAKTVLLLEDNTKLREVNVELTKALNKSKKSKLVLIGLGVAAGVVLGVLLTN